MESPGLDVNGEWPDLDGRTCAALIVAEYWHENSLNDPANVIWLRVDETWHLLYFDLGIVYWRGSIQDPSACEMPELNAEIRLMDLGTSQGFVGEVITSIGAREIEGGAAVELRFASGRALVFRNFADRTTYAMS